jgi:hypothetical protein
LFASDSWLTKFAVFAFDATGDDDDAAVDEDGVGEAEAPAAAAAEDAVIVLIIEAESPLGCKDGDDEGREDLGFEWISWITSVPSTSLFLQIKDLYNIKIRNSQM